MKKTMKRLLLLAVMCMMTLCLGMTVQAKASLSKKSLSIVVSKSATLEMRGTDKKVKWSSSNSKIARVNSKGKITGLKKGSAKIFAKVGTKTYSCKVTVKAGLNKSKITLKAKDSAKIKLFGDKIKSIKSNKNSIASVSKKGKIKARKPGKCKITVKGKSGKKYICKVTVTEPTANKTVESKKPVYYSVTFECNGGSPVPPQTVQGGQRAAIPVAPTKTGYTFAGWYKDASLRIPFRFSTVITENVVLYAKWDKKVDGTYTRGEWIGKLAEMVDMNLNTDPNSINYYFGDTEGTEYAIAIETARGYGILPPAEVQDPDQDVPLFYPSQVATREFAAYTAVRAMGFGENNGLDGSAWLDWFEVNYKDEAAIAVNFGFLTLSENRFYPASPIDSKDIGSIQEAIMEIRDSAKVTDANAHDDSVYLGSVEKDTLKSIQDYTVMENAGSYVITMPVTPATAFIEEGKVIVLPGTDRYPTGIALKVTGVKVANGTVGVSGVAPEIEEVFSKIDFGGYATAMLGEITPADGVSVEVVNDANQPAPILHLGGSAPIPGKINVKIPIKKFGKFELKGNLEVKIPDVTCILDADVGLFKGIQVNEFTLSVEENIKITGEISSSVNSGYELTDSGAKPGLGFTGSDTRFSNGRFEIYRMPFALGTTGMSVDIVFFANVSAKGAVSITYSIDSRQGFQYKNGTPRGIFDFKDSLDALDLRASGTVGIGAAVDLCAFELMDLVGYSIELGVGFNASATPHVLATDTLYCADATLYGYLKHGLDKETVVGKFLEKVCKYTLEFEPLKNNSENPLRCTLHLENGKRVSECTFGKGSLEGHVQNFDTGDALSGAKIEIYKGEELIRTRYSDTNGHFSVDNLACDEYKIVIKATGFYKYEIVQKIEPYETSYLEATLMVDRINSGEGELLYGRIIDAVTGEGIDGASYVFRKGGNNLTGEIVAEGVFESDEYETSLGVGNYTLTVSKEGYITNYIHITISNTMCSTGDVVLTPEGVDNPETGDVFRVVLTWGETPEDLDSHMFGPSAGDEGYRFHTYFSDEAYYNPDGVLEADLDLDDTDSYGPETTTIYRKATSGTYSYYVHDFTNQYESYSTAMSNSRAQVKVYYGKTLYRTFNIPTGRDGTVWHVFDLDAATGNIKAVNTFHYSEEPEDVEVAVILSDDFEQSDLNAIITSGKVRKDTDAGTERPTEAEEIESEDAEPEEPTQNNAGEQTQSEITLSGDWEQNDETDMAESEQADESGLTESEQADESGLTESEQSSEIMETESNPDETEAPDAQGFDDAPTVDSEIIIDIGSAEDTTEEETLPSEQQESEFIIEE